MKPRTRWMLLVILFGIWSGAAAWVLTQFPEPQRVALTHVSGQKGRIQAGSRKPGPDLQIHLELLAANRRRTEKGFGSPKNIFAPVLPGQLGGMANLPAVQASPEELALQVGRQELAQFRYLGYLSRAGRSQAFLAKGNALHIVKTGETIEQRILVKAITPSGVTLQETTTNTEQFVSPSADVPAIPGPPAMVPSQMAPSGYNYNGAAPPGFPGPMPGMPGMPGNMPQPFSPGTPPAF
jgi:hypothetical protein